MSFMRKSMSSKRLKKQSNARADYWSSDLLSSSASIDRRNTLSLSPIAPQRGVECLSALARMVADTPEQRAAYNALLRGLRLSAAFNSGKSVLVTSIQPNEGKTTVASCLAITASLAGHSVLLIDGDLRRPWSASAAGIADAVGLSEVLEGEVKAAEAIHLVELFTDSREAGPISVMAAGRRRPALLPTVDWSRARTMFQVVSRPFDIVLFDSSPVLAAGDPLLLAGIADGVVLVVRAESANRDEVRRAKDRLHRIGTPLIGAVLNQYDPKIHYRPDQPYHGHYHGLRP
jgi:capsular exopolysaccharide synthesis family protein